MTLQQNLLDKFADSLDILNNDEVLDIGPMAIEEIGNRIITFQDQDLKIRSQMADALSAKKRFNQAARTLAQAHLDQSSKIPMEKRAEVFIKIAEYQLQADNNADAYNFINKASHYVPDLTDISLQLRYQLVFTTIEDQNRKFISAALNYFELSQKADCGLSETELLTLLGKAMTCTILAPSGPQKSRILANLYKDERAKRLPNFELLEKM